MWRIRGLGLTLTFFAHADAEALLQPAVLALVPVVLVDLTLSVRPAKVKNWDWKSAAQMFPFSGGLCVLPVGARQMC